MDRTTLEVGGMSCSGCEETVIDALESLEGVASVTANYEADTVRVEHDEAAIDETTLGGAVEDAGYDVVG